MSEAGSSGDGEFSILLLLLQQRSRLEYCQKLH